jgi:hypothetical protein
VEVHCDEGVAIHIGPEPCVGAREGIGEASAGDCIGQPSSRESALFPGADAVPLTEGNTPGAISRVPGRPGAVGDPGMCRRSLYGNREISHLTGAARRGRPASGRPRAEADDARMREVRPRRSSCEPGEQSGFGRGGVGGAKDEDQGEREPAKHLPGTEPDLVSQALERVRKVAGLRNLHPWSEAHFAVRHPR